ncbi:MAG: citryl-CoA lyase [Alphaproteobacteria bacterium]|nr:citryl-CoA lyase [Alphaproteobacteria bacterium]
MSADNMANWRTGIAEVVSTETEEEVLIRGRKLSELIGSLSFAEMMFLLLTGREPTKPQARVLDALLVASIEHGIAPPSMIARCYASYGTSIQAAMAGGIMAFGDTMGGAGEQLAKMLSEAAAGLDVDPSDDALRQLAADIVGRGGRIPGYGIPLHGADPRSPKMLSVAREEGCFGTHCRLAELIEQEIERTTGKSIPLNLDGVGAVVILDLGFPWQLTRMFLITPRSVSFAAHYYEEQQQGTKWRHLAADDITYES